MREWQAPISHAALVKAETIYGELCGGESIGFRNVLIRFPEQRLDIVLLSNRNDPEPYALARRIAALWGAPQP